MSTTKRGLTSSPPAEEADCRTANKRRLVRFPCETGVMVAFWKSDRFFLGRLCDFTGKGLGFKAPYRIRPGSLIFIVAEEQPPVCPCRHIQKGCLSEIVWVRHTQAADRFTFQFGGRFIDTSGGGIRWNRPASRP